MTTVWLIVFLALVVLEFATINLVSIWFAIGALVSFFVSLYVEELTVQVAVFVIVSFICILLTKNVIRKFRNPVPTKTNLDRVIGEIGVVTEAIDSFNPGEVKVDGKKWSATCDHPLKVGDKVEILAIDGVKLVVQKETSIEK